ncbi:MAG: hypothetical protein AAGD25_18905 [Cyanobacteria bacterium P01_F01_bin.150]
MTLQELQQQIVQLPIEDRWQLVQATLASIQQDTLTPKQSNQDKAIPLELDSWTQSLIGVIQLGSEESSESYVDYLEEKYR